MSTEQTPMTQERLEAIRARLADVGAIWKYAATPTGDGEVITVGQEGPIAWGIDIDSAALIAHAPQDLADLLAEVKRLRALTTVDEDMVERAARALFLARWYTNTEDKWARFPEVVRESWRMDARDVLDAALNPGEGS